MDEMKSERAKAASCPATEGHPGEERTVLPVVEEQLEVGKRVVEGGGVRLTRRVEEEQQVIEQALRREAVEVERVPVNRLVSGPQGVRQEGETLVIPIVEEVLVVQKQLVLREELHVRKRMKEETRPQTVTVRKQVVDVERVESRANPETGGTGIAGRG